MGEMLDALSSIIGLINRMRNTTDDDERQDAGEEALGLCAGLREEIEAAEHLMEIVHLHAVQDSEQA